MASLLKTFARALLSLSSSWETGTVSWTFGSTAWRLLLSLAAPARAHSEKLAKSGHGHSRHMEQRGCSQISNGTKELVLPWCQPLAGWKVQHKHACCTSEALLAVPTANSFGKGPKMSQILTPSFGTALLSVCPMSVEQPGAESHGHNARKGLNLLLCCARSLKPKLKKDEP